MIQLLMYALAMITSLMFLYMNHPLAMGLTLLAQTLFIALLTGLMASTFWFSYVLFLIFLGGMLILFIYVTSLASNEMFSLSMKLLMTALILFMMTAMAILLVDKPLAVSVFMNNEMTNLLSPNSLLPENILMLNKLYNFPTNLITLLLMNYLLITLIAIVKITNVFYGPLRPVN